MTIRRQRTFTNLSTLSALIITCLGLLSHAVPALTSEITFPESCDVPKCRLGTPVVNPSHTPTFNGCGVPGFMVNSGDYDMTPCCNVHDICYDTCGNSRRKCDNEFLKCMNTICEKFKGKRNEECKGTASMFHMGTSLLGCAAYQKSQQNACLCQETIGDDDEEPGLVIPSSSEAEETVEPNLFEALFSAMKPIDDTAPPPAQEEEPPKIIENARSEEQEPGTKSSEEIREGFVNSQGSWSENDYQPDFETQTTVAEEPTPSPVVPVPEEEPVEPEFADDVEGDGEDDEEVDGEEEFVIGSDEEESGNGELADHEEL